jgi:hypothetical protein
LHQDGKVINKDASRWLDYINHSSVRSGEGQGGGVHRVLCRIFPSIEVIPQPPVEYRVMFYAFLFRGFTLPAHEFLHGLLFIYGVQLDQLTPNYILHITCFITLCEAFLGIDPHWVLWKYLFLLRHNASKNEVHDLGGAIIFVRPKSQYLKFEMADSVQNLREKWFYIKDQKSSESDKYGLAPFDATKGLTKL